MTRKQTGPKFKDGWGDTIRELRELHGYSQGGLAEVLHVSKASISKWEQEAMVPSLSVAKELADLFNVHIETIFDI